MNLEFHLQNIMAKFRMGALDRYIVFHYFDYKFHNVIQDLICPFCNLVAQVKKIFINEVHFML